MKGWCGKMVTCGAETEKMLHERLRLKNGYIKN